MVSNFKNKKIISDRNGNISYLLPTSTAVQRTYPHTSISAECPISRRWTKIQLLPTRRLRPYLETFLSQRPPGYVSFEQRFQLPPLFHRDRQVHFAYDGGKL